MVGDGEAGCPESGTAKRLHKAIIQTATRTDLFTDLLLIHLLLCLKIKARKLATVNLRAENKKQTETKQKDKEN